MFASNEESGVVVVTECLVVGRIFYKSIIDLRARLIKNKSASGAGIFCIVAPVENFNSMLCISWISTGDR